LTNVTLPNVAEETYGWGPQFNAGVAFTGIAFTRAAAFTVAVFVGEWRRNAGTIGAFALAWESFAGGEMAIVVGLWAAFVPATSGETFNHLGTLANDKEGPKVSSSAGRDDAKIFA
jgi:hypothetical protein